MISVKKTTLGILVSVAAASALYASPTKAELDSMKKIVGYFPEWGIYSGHNNYVPAKVPFDKITHLNYAFATIKNGVIANFDNYAATEATLGEAWDSPYKGNLGQFKKLKKAYPHLSVLVSVGGWTQSGNFHDVAATQEARDRFAASVIQYIRTYDFDGVDIDWEYPGSYRAPDTTDNANDQGTPKADDSEKETFTLLLKTLREHLDKASKEDGKYYQLTAAMGASFRNIEFADPSKYAQYLDFINLMTYDMHGAWDAQTNHQSALYANPDNPDDLNVDAVVEKFLSYGVDPKKLIVGTPFYSRGWKGVVPCETSSGHKGLFCEADGGAHGVWDGGTAGGMNPYYHVVEMEKDPSFTHYYDEAAKAPYLYSESKQEFYTYENKRSLQEKVDYVEQKHLGGMIIWELSADAPVSSPDALLPVIADSFYPQGIHIGSEDNSTDDTATGGDTSGDTGSGNADTSGGDQNGEGNSGDTGSDSAAPWDASAVYVGGELVIYEGITYKAKWWTQGDIPGTQEWGPWEAVDGSSGNGSSTDTGSGSGTDDNASGTDGDNGTWDASKIYVGGEIVVYGGKKYKAQWWTQGDVPGTEEWGPWKEVDETAPVDDPDPDPLPVDENMTDTGGTDDANTTVTVNGVVSLQALQQKEAELTDTPLMKLTKASIRTLPNEEVDQIVPGRADNPANVKRVESIVSPSDWSYLFPERSPEYTYENFLKAVGKFPAFCGDYDDGRDADTICRRSLATIFAHFTQETGGHNPATDVPQWRQGLVYVREMGWTEQMRNGYNAECSLDTWQGKAFPCGKFDDGSFKSYFGRGAKQLSYNYNYGAFSEAMTGDKRTLLDHPELVADTWYNLASAVFFFVYPQPPKPSMLFVIDGTWQPNASDKANGLVPGFGVTTNIINGGVECGGSSEHAQSLNRIAYYKEFAQYLNVPVADDEVLGCANMKQFTSDSAAALPIYWEEDWSWNANSADGRSYSCQLVNYQTPYSAFREGDYVRCAEEKFSVSAE